ncbi:MAG TPA: hypothetical protein VJ813_21060 [Vicinamibacterales bacterium]|nr:hypothetical protein [Vicinamibacterales bacterium]
MASVFSPKRPEWFRGAVVAAAAALLVYFVWAWWTPWRPGRAGGLTFGTIAALLFFYDGLYPLRARLLAWPFRTAQQWLQLHIYGGVIAMLCVLIHAGFAWPTGTMGWWLLGLSVWTTFTGVLGTMLQKWIPTVIAGSLRVEALTARMPELTARLLTEADGVMRGASDRLWAAYQSDIRPRLERPEPAWAHVANAQSGRSRYAGPLAALDRVADADRANELRAIVTEKAELDVHLSLQRALRAWLFLHVPPAVALLGLLAVHIFAVLYL